MLYQQTAILLIPFLGTSLGSAMVFFTKNKINEKFQKFLLGFASGVMIAASVWSLIIPSVEMSAEQNVIEWLPAAVGFLLGMGFLFLLDSVIPHLHLNSDKPEGVKSRLSKNTMLVLAVTLHNIPEGMAVGKISFFIPSSCDIMIIRYIINQNSINQKLRRIHNERKNGDYFHADKINPACFRRVAFTC